MTRITRRGSRSLPRVAQANAISAPATVIRSRSAGNQNAFNVGNRTAALALPTQISFTLDNSGGGTAKKYLMFDPIGIISGLTGQAATDQTTDVLTPAIVNKFVENNPLLFNQIKIVATASEAQFDNKMMPYVGVIDGGLSIEPIVLNTALNNDQYNAKIQSYNVELYANVNRGIIYQVDAGEKVKVTFYIKAGFNEL